MDNAVICTEAIQQVRKLKQDRKALIREIEKLLPVAYPLGAVVRFEKGGYLIGGEVLRWCCERVRIRNVVTDKEYWLGAEWLLGEEGR